MGVLGYFGSIKLLPMGNEILHFISGVLTFTLVGVWSVLIRKIILKEDL